uniref:Uncharacterized protein n=1 Tax=Anguilla anguilla TaxID=7936 RepID=A0A0E9U0K1_ANGAN
MPINLSEFIYRPIPMPPLFYCASISTVKLILARGEPF